MMPERRKNDRDSQASYRKWAREFWDRKREDAKRLAELSEGD